MSGPGIQLTPTGEVAVQRALALVHCKHRHLAAAKSWKDFAKNEEVSAMFAQLASDFWLKQHYLTGRNYTAVRWGTNYDRSIAQAYPFFGYWTYSGGEWNRNRRPYQIAGSVFADG